MSTLEELEQRKKELLLRSEIAKLEREHRTSAMAAKTAAWSWWWVGPLSLVGLFFVIAVGLSGYDGIQPGAIAFGLLLLVPLLLKVLGSRTA